MKQEEQDILLRDLCSRQPYGVKGRCEVDASYDTEFDSIYQTHCFDAELIGIKEDIIFVIPLIEDEDENTYACEEVADGIDISDFTPYLRPLSSITEEEKKYIKCRWCYDDWTDICDFLNNYKIDAGDAYDFTDWLIANHFDYRGLIPKGLVLEAPEGMYNLIEREEYDN
jgi:hypothetical protein